MSKWSKITVTELHDTRNFSVSKFAKQLYENGIDSGYSTLGQGFEINVRLTGDNAYKTMKDIVKLIREEYKLSFSVEYLVSE
jgi:hypothetical protein